MMGKCHRAVQAHNLHRTRGKLNVTLVTTSESWRHVRAATPHLAERRGGILLSDLFFLGGGGWQTSGT